MQLTACYLYPIKSCAALPLQHSVVEPRGLRGDRRWLVVDGEHRFITGRQQPRMTLIVAEPTGRGLRLSAPGMPSIEVATPDRPEPVTVEVWKKPVGGVPASDEASAWVADFLGIEARLAYMADTIERPVDPAYAREGDVVSYADSFPLMLIGAASLDGLNQRLQQPVPMTQFRPNLVVDTDTPHEEDHWRRIAIGEVEFDVAKACTRCNFVNVDPVRGERVAGGEPLKTLAGYRRVDSGVIFGRHLIARSPGSIRLGDRVEVLERQAG